jgi:hypothetical protein
LGLPLFYGKNLTNENYSLHAGEGFFSIKKRSENVEKERIRVHAIRMGDWAVKSLWTKGAAMALLSLTFACSEEVVNRRGEVAASMALPANPDTKDGDVQTDPGKSSDFVGPTLTEAKNNAGLTPEFKANINLVNKVSATEIVLFGKDGKSWLYNPAADAVPTQMEPAIVQPTGYSLFTLPDGKFWLVGPQTLGRRKAGEAAGTSVPVENFNTSSIKGDWTKVRILYAAVDTIILHLDTNIAILAIRNGTPSVSQFNSALPVPLEGGIVAAGETESGGYWFSGKETVALLELSGLSLAWSRAKVPLVGHEDYAQIAMRIDSTKKEVSGDVLVFQADKYWSVSGAAIQ